MAGLPSNHELGQGQSPSITTSKTQAIPYVEQVDLLALAKRFPFLSFVRNHEERKDTFHLLFRASFSASSCHCLCDLFITYLWQYISIKSARKQELIREQDKI